MYLIAGSAFLFYVTKIPERYFPGESSFFLSLTFFVYRSEMGSLKPIETLGHQKKNSTVKVTVSVTKQ